MAGASSGSAQAAPLQYSLVHVVEGVRVIGYDNERGKGDHRHWRGVETPYLFVSMSRLLEDFIGDVNVVRAGGNEGQSGT